ncbi:MAG: aromatic acid exporter family protein [Lachnospiraceae bacterium]
MLQKEYWLKSLKITLGAILAIVLATLLGLKYSATAGIITILSIQNTKRETLQTALARTLAFGCALLLSAVCYYLLGFTIPAFGFYLLGFSLVCLIAGWTAAIAMDSVLITHFLAEASMSPSLIINELLLFGIGTLMGILLNIHLHPKKEVWQQKVQEIDESIRSILQRMAVRVRSLDRSNYDGSCFEALDKTLEQAKQIALTNMDNRFSSTDTYELDYVEMRSCQCGVLKNIYRSIHMIAFLPKQAQLVASFFERIVGEYDMQNDVSSLLDELKILMLSMKNEPLPKSREEFESRAVLFYILKQLEEFLMLKQKFMRDGN